MVKNKSIQSDRASPRQSFLNYKNKLNDKFFQRNTNKIESANKYPVLSSNKVVCLNMRSRWIAVD